MLIFDSTLYKRSADRPQGERSELSILTLQSDQRKQSKVKMDPGVRRDDGSEVAAQSANPRSRSLMLVFARVLASTCLTITAQYSEWLPSFAGSEPDTTTLPGGTLP